MGAVQKTLKFQTVKNSCELIVSPSPYRRLAGRYRSTMSNYSLSNCHKYITPLHIALYYKHISILGSCLPFLHSLCKHISFAMIKVEAAKSVTPP